MAFRSGRAGFGGRLGAATTAAALVFAFALGGCATEDDGAAAEASSPGGAASTAATATPTARAASDLKAADYVYTGGPETSGFEQEPGADGLGSDEADELGCEGVFDSSPDSTGWADGPTLTKNGGLVFVGSTAYIQPAKKVAEDVTAVRTQKFHDCAVKVLGESIGGADDPTQSTETMGELEERDVPLPDGAAARFALTVNMTTDGVTVPLFMDILLFGKGQVESMASVSSVLNPPDDLVTAIAAQMVAKLNKQ
ncbi:hypothetical protein Ga0074812_11242 [Parafrankia irregularis]|uniref:PknH-like extracellular domain-containing protein n=1 Tax=Parafrankia irregularis TaxID=795642 RepID=A0A0S4QSI7_9ACTN|nr:MULTISPECIES: hypothetical protein [Parafrankia]MBE3201642.1 hypothetical protein [Parafrankia sp. CH37]CUU57382.1 hypothetical protein Ga0074812_11242 [Parafrankia irregularis]